MPSFIDSEYIIGAKFYKTGYVVTWPWPRALG